jgi:chromosome segregation ATPase
LKKIKGIKKSIEEKRKRLRELNESINAEIEKITHSEEREQLQALRGRKEEKMTIENLQSRLACLQKQQEIYAKEIATHQENLKLGFIEDQLKNMHISLMEKDSDEASLRAKNKELDQKCKEITFNIEQIKVSRNENLKVVIFLFSLNQQISCI